MQENSEKIIIPVKAPEIDTKTPRIKVDLNLPVKTIFKILLVALVVYVTIALSSIIVTLFLGTMLAVTLYPLLRHLEKRGFPSWVGVTIVISAILLSGSLIFTMILPPLIEQGTLLMDNLPHLREAVIQHVPATGPFHDMATRMLSEVEKADPSNIVTPLVSVGQMALGGFTELFLVLIFTIYLLTDGPRALDWLLAFFNGEKRAKLKATGEETSKVIAAYVGGQLITSLICGVYTMIVLSVLHVPAALMLATIAAIFDVLPVLGFFLAAAPALMLGLTISPFTGFLVLALYVLYHAIENYLLIPKIYGNRLRLSDLVVLVSLLAAGTLGGIIGAIVVLPLVASYPIIERIWLVDFLGDSVVSRHGGSKTI